MRWRIRTSLITVCVLVMTLFSPTPMPASPSRAFAVDEPPLPRMRDIPVNLRPRAFWPDAISADDFTFGWRPDHAYVADPVDVVTGAFTIGATDLTVHGRGINFEFTRTYNSADDWWRSNSPMGAGWSNTFDWVLEDDVCSRFYSLRRGDGGRGTVSEDISFTNDGAPMATRTYTLVTHDQLIYTFGDPIIIDSGVDWVPPTCTYYYYHYRLRSIRNQAGDTLTLGYDLIGSPGAQQLRLSTVSDSLGGIYHLTYAGGCNYLYRLDDPFGRSVTFNNDTYCTLTSVTDLAGRTTTYGYDALGSRHIAAITDPDGRVRPTNTYVNGRITRQVDGEGNATTVSYYDDPYTGQHYGTYVTDPRGATTYYNVYAQCGTLTVWTRAVASESTVVNGVNYMTTYEYDMSCHRSAIIDPLGNRTDFSYTGPMFLASRSDPTVAGGRPVTSYQYDTKWNLTRIADPRGFATERTYDQTTGALLSERRQIDATTFATTTYAYSDARYKLLPTTITSPRGYATTLIYDASANLSRKTDPDGVATNYGYDSIGRQTTVTDAESRVTTTAYDNADRVLSATDPLGAITRYSYDGAGNRTSVTDRLGNVTSYTYDRNSRLVNMQQHPNQNTTYTTTIARDGNSNVTRMTEGNGVQRDSAYDAFNRVISTTEYTSQGTLTTIYTRDGNGNVTSRRTPDGVSVSYTYDALARLTGVGATGLSISYAYDLAGNRTQMQDATGSTTYAYDGASRIISVAAPAGTVTYVYDLDGNRTALGYPGAGTVAYVYSPAGRLSTVTDWATRVSSYAYRANGLVSSVTYPNGMAASYSYDAAGRLTQLTNAIGQTTITRHTYTLDAEGNRRTLAEFVSGITALGATDTIDYTYDGLNRLSGSTGALAESFSFDGASNVTNRTGPSATYTYDATDRLQSDGTLQFGWSQADQLTSRGVPVVPPQVTFRDQANANNGGGATTLTISRPAATQPGDLLLALVYIDHANATIDTPVGWTALSNVTISGSHKGAVFYRFASNADPASWSFTFGRYFFQDDDYPYVAPAEGTILTYSNVNSATPLSPATAAATTGSGATPAANTLSLAYPNELVVASYGQVASSTAATPSGWTARTSYAPSTSAGALKIDERRYTAIGSSDGVQWSSSANSSWVSFAVGLVPTPPAPPSGDSFVFDAIDRLAYATVSGVTRTLGYDGDRYLTSRTTPGSSVTLLWDATTTPKRLLAVGGDFIVYGLTPLYSVNGSSLTTYARDGQLSTRAELVGTSVSASFRYRSYGALAQSQGASGPKILGYAGQLLDPSGLYYMRARWYDVTNARFVTRETTGGDAASPQSLNGYAYAGGNPLLWRDSTGLARESVDTPIDVDDGSSIGGSSLCGPHDCAGSSAPGPSAGGSRFPRDIGVNPRPPEPLDNGRPISNSFTQNQAAQARIEQLEQLGARDIRVNQQMVNAQGQRVGVNRPDIQYTWNGQRYYEEYETQSIADALAHEARILANDPEGIFIPRWVP